MPPELTDDEIEAILAKADDLTSWISDIKDYAMQQALSGKHWSQWKLVEGVPSANTPMKLPLRMQ